MSIYYVKKGGKHIATTVHDGKTHSLNYLVDLELNDIFYYMGKQIGMKRLKPGTKTWLSVMKTAMLLWRVNVEEREENAKRNNNH